MMNKINYLITYRGQWRSMGMSTLPENLETWSFYQVCYVTHQKSHLIYVSLPQHIPKTPNVCDQISDQTCTYAI